MGQRLPEADSVIRRRLISQSACCVSGPAVFLDRDGTVTRYGGFVTQPDQIELSPGAAEVLRVLKERGFCCVVISNQSAIGRGMLTEEGLAEIHAELLRQLEAEGVALGAIYWCPDMPTCDDETVVENHDRKPGPGMLLAAARVSGGALKPATRRRVKTSR